MLLPGQNLSINFTLPASGQALVNFDSAPTGQLCRNGIDQGSSVGSIVVNNISTGRYQITGFIPSGWNPGDWVDVIVSGTVSAAAVLRTINLGAIDALQALGDANVVSWLSQVPLTLNAQYVQADAELFNGQPYIPLQGPITIDQTSLAGATIIVQSPVAVAAISIVEKDAYLTADGRQLAWVKPAGANWPSTLSGWTITFTATKSASNVNLGTTTISTTGSVLVAQDGGGLLQKISVDLPSALTTGLAPGAGSAGYLFDVVATNGTDRATLISGLMTVQKNVTP